MYREREAGAVDRGLLFAHRELARTDVLRIRAIGRKSEFN